MEQEEFNDLEKYIDKDYKHINAYKIEDAIFYIEPNFYTQLTYLKTHLKDKYQELIKDIKEVAKRNKKVIFTGDFESPVVYKSDYIYREIGDCLADIKSYFDNKCNPDSDYKD